MPDCIFHRPSIFNGHCSKNKIEKTFFNIPNYDYFRDSRLFFVETVIM